MHKHIVVYVHFSIENSICPFENRSHCDCFPFSLSLSSSFDWCDAVILQTTYNLFDSYQAYTHSEPAHSLEWPPSTSFIFRPHKRSYLCSIVWIVVFVIGNSDGYGGNDGGEGGGDGGVGSTVRVAISAASMVGVACTRFSTFIRIRIRMYGI